MSKVSSLPGDIGAQIPTGHGTIGGPFDQRPPLRVNVDSIFQPVGNELLTGGLALVQLPEALDEQGLLPVSNQPDRFAKSGNVTVLGVVHRDAAYTNGFVSVNMPVCVTENKKVCNVVDLGIHRNVAVQKARKLPVPAKKPERKAKPGPDGCTLGDRLHRAMAYRAGMLHREYEPVDLLQEANELVGATAEAPVISQQIISEILRGRTSRSSFTPYLAKACGVSSLWLAIGKGPMIEK